MAKTVKHGGAPPPESEVSSLPREAVKRDFAKRLQNIMADKGWTQSDLARHAAKYTPDKKFGRDNVSNYVRAETLPGPVHLRALSKALNVAEETLLPTRGVTSGSNSTVPVDVREAGNGRAWLRINQAVEWPTALKILELLKGEQ